MSRLNSLRPCRSANTVAVLSLLVLLLPYGPANAFDYPYLDVNYTPDGASVTSSVFLFATGDTFISAKESSTNAGSNFYMQTRNDYGQGGGAGWEKDVLIKFDLGAFGPLDVIHSATLYLYYDHKGDNDPAGNKLTIYRVDSPWDENTVTFDSRPNLAAATDNAYVPTYSRSWMSWNVTEDVDKFSKLTATNYGWQIQDETYWGTTNIPITYFRTREVHPLPEVPTLSEWSFIALALVMMAGAAVLIRSRYTGARYSAPNDR